MFTVIVTLQVAPHYAAWRAVADRCVVEGGHVNTFAAPVFPDDLPEAVTVTEEAR